MSVIADTAAEAARATPAGAALYASTFSTLNLEWWTQWLLLAYAGASLGYVVWKWRTAYLDRRKEKRNGTPAG